MCILPSSWKLYLRKRECRTFSIAKLLCSNYAISNTLPRACQLVNLSTDNGTLLREQLNTRTDVPTYVLTIDIINISMVLTNYLYLHNTITEVSILNSDLQLIFTASSFLIHIQDFSENFCQGIQRKVKILLSTIRKGLGIIAQQWQRGTALLQTFMAKRAYMWRRLRSRTGWPNVPPHPATSYKQKVRQVLNANFERIFAGMAYSLIYLQAKASGFANNRKALVVHVQFNFKLVPTSHQ